MKVILLNGSRREKGCTYTALSVVADTLKENGIDAEIVHALPDDIVDADVISHGKADDVTFLDGLRIEGIDISHRHQCIGRDRDGLGHVLLIAQECLAQGQDAAFQGTAQGLAIDALFQRFHPDQKRFIRNLAGVLPLHEIDCRQQR